MLPGVKSKFMWTSTDLQLIHSPVLRTVKRAFLLIALPVELTVSTIYVRIFFYGISRVETLIILHSGD